MNQKTAAQTEAMKPKAGEVWHVEDWAGAIVRKVKPATMTPPSRIYNLVKAVENVCRAGIGGDLVECGVWRGGSLMTMALTLLHCGDTSRRLHSLYPRLVEGGMLLIDDYDCFKGSKEATDEYFATLEQPPLLWAIDHHARAGVKPPAPLQY